MKYLYIFTLFFCTFLNAQSTTKKVLFIGNSYTSKNNLPLMVKQIATSTGDVLIFDKNTPGGYTLQYHSNDPITLQKINVGTWDYVVLQEQSQLPSFSSSEVETRVFPYAKKLNDIIKAKNPLT